MANSHFDALTNGLDNLIMMNYSIIYHNGILPKYIFIERPNFFLEKKVTKIQGLIEVSIILKLVNPRIQSCSSIFACYASSAHGSPSPVVLYQPDVFLAQASAISFAKNNHETSIRPSKLTS